MLVENHQRWELELKQEDVFLDHKLSTSRNRVTCEVVSFYATFDIDAYMKNF
jgi:hypothetical protein